MLFMPNHLPPLAALRALEATSRHRSFTRAAVELNVTQSAISHQIRNLEKFWDLELFERGTRPLSLTKSGAALGHELINEIEMGGADLIRYKAQIRRKPSGFQGFATL